MNWEAIGAIGEILGAIGVILTLVYLAIQIRQNTSATRTATAQQMTDNWVSINMQISANPLPVTRDLRSDLTAEEHQSTMAFWRAVFHQWSNNHYQYTHGGLDEALFRPTREEIVAYATVKGSGHNLRIAWESARFIYNADFGTFLDSLLEENPLQGDGT